MLREGTLARTAGLHPTKEGFRIRSNRGKVSVTEGPFTETDEWNLECEVRPLDGEEFCAG